jgi:hypothetical protein
MPYTQSQKDFALYFLNAVRSHINSSTVPKAPYDDAMLRELDVLLRIGLRFFSSKIRALHILDVAIAKVEAETVVPDGTTFIIEYRAKFSADSNEYRRSLQFGGVYETYDEARAVIKGKTERYRVTVVPPAKPEPLLDPYCVGETDPRVHAMVGSIVVEIDFDRLERDVLKGLIDDSNVQKLLPFKTDVEAGDTYNHIVNASAYTVETNSHFIHEGGTLCARAGGSFRTHRDAKPTCPGCLIKAKSIIVEHLIATSPELGG